MNANNAPIIHQFWMIVINVQILQLVLFAKTTNICTL